MPALGESIKVVTGSNDGRMTVDGARFAVLIVAALSAVGASKFTRKRVDEGQEAIFGLLF